MNVDWKAIKKFIKENNIDRIYVYDDEILLIREEDGYWTGTVEIVELYSVKDVIINQMDVKIRTYITCGNLLLPKCGAYSEHPARNCYDCLCWYDINSRFKLLKSRTYFERAMETKKMNTFHINDIGIVYRYT